MAPRKTKPRARARKPHSASVTAVPCKCKTLERNAEEPDCPVFFDAELNEYNIENRRRRSRWNIYHCYFCGGAAPRSKRASLFATIPGRERERLTHLISGFADFDEVLARFGKPDEDMPVGVTDSRDATETTGPTVTPHRALRYHGLSKVADVEFIDYGPKHGVRASLQGKYIGPPRPRRA
ncbi:MAG TPA: hypothetical protein VGH28_29995 [Polyangiaceae bacterium]|jgi:hypothetical protein